MCQSIYLGSWLQSLQPLPSLPHCFWAMVRESILAEGWGGTELFLRHPGNRVTCISPRGLTLYGSVASPQSIHILNSSVDEANDLVRVLIIQPLSKSPTSKHEGPTLPTWEPFGGATSHPSHNTRAWTCKLLWRSIKNRKPHTVLP